MHASKIMHYWQLREARKLKCIWTFRKSVHGRENGVWMQRDPLSRAMPLSSAVRKRPWILCGMPWAGLYQATEPLNFMHRGRREMIFSFFGRGALKRIFHLRLWCTMSQRGTILQRRENHASIHLPSTPSVTRTQ